MVVLRAKVSSAIYNNFLLLSICTRVLLSEEDIIDIDYTKQLLVSFVTNAAKIYGKQILVYNMPNILHIVDDVKMYGRLDNISCFQYENALGQLKRLVKKPQHPIAQIVRRLHEQGQQQGPQNTEFSLHMQHYSGPIIFEHSHWTQFKKNRGKFLISCIPGDNCFFLDNCPVIIRNIVCSPSKQINVIFSRFEFVKSFFESPFDSRLIRLYQVSHLSEVLCSTNIDNCKCKFVLIPLHKFDNSFVAMPLLHHNDFHQ